jgi:hypothetical protein
MMILKEEEHKNEESMTKYKKRRNIRKMGKTWSRKKKKKKETRKRKSKIKQIYCPFMLTPNL